TRALHHLPVFDHQLAHGLEHLATHLHCPWRVHLAAHHVHHPAAHHGAHTALHPLAVRCRRRGGRLLLALLRPWSLDDGLRGQREKSEYEYECDTTTHVLLLSPRRP